MTRSNSRRFVNAAWSLLAFQLIAAAGAVAVTGWAAFHVQAITSGISTQQAEPATPDDNFGAIPDPTAPTPDNQDSGLVPAAPAAPPMQAAPCVRMQNPIRVDARAGWCDSGLTLEAGQRYFVRRGDGRWSNAGAPSYGAEGGGPWDGTIVAGAPLGALIGRVGDVSFVIGAGPEFTSPASGQLYLSINDVPGTFDDNQGWIETYIYGANAIQ